MSKSPSLVFNASRMARMVGGLQSSVIATNNKSRDKRRTQHMLQSKSGHELGGTKRAMAAIVNADDEYKNSNEHDASLSHQDKTVESLNSA